MGHTLGIVNTFDDEPRVFNTSIMIDKHFELYGGFQELTCSPYVCVIRQIRYRSTKAIDSDKHADTNAQLTAF